MTATGDLGRQVEELRAMVETLRAASLSQPRVTVRGIEPAPYLGQAIGLVVAVSGGADSGPITNLPVTLVTTWGVLRGDDDLIEGTSIVSTTGSDGTMRVTLRARVSLNDNEDQDALESVLAELDPGAASPADTIGALQDMARQYRWEANHGLRNAVDAYFREFGKNVVHGAAFRDYMVAWSLIPATVIAYVGETDTSSTGAVATTTVKFRDWLGPWFQTYQAYASSQIALDPDLELIKKRAVSAGGLVAGIFGRATSAVEGEFGEVGRRVAQQTAQKSIDNFLGSGIADLPVATRLAVGPALDTGARSLLTAGPGVVEALGETHVAAVTAADSIAGKVDKADLAAALSTKANTADVQGIQATLAGKADRAALDALQAQTNAALAAKADLAALQSFQAATNAALTGKASVADLQAVQTAVAAKADLSALTAFQTQVNGVLASKADLTALQSFQTQMNGALASKVDTTTFEGFRTQVNGRLVTTVTRSDLDGLRASMQDAINAKADRAALDTLRTDTTTALASKADASALTSVHSRITTLERGTP